MWIKQLYLLINILHEDLSLAIIFSTSMKPSIFLIALLFTTSLYAQQIWAPPEPQTYKYSPVDLNNTHTHSYDAQKVVQDFNYGYGGQTPELRSHKTTQQQIEEQNTKLTQMGHMPSKQTPDQQLTSKKQKHIDEAYQDLLKAEKANPVFSTTAKRDPVTEDKKLRKTDTTSAEYRSSAHFFFEAFKEYIDMLEGRKTLSIERAVFINENAFLGGKLNYTDYQKDIEKHVQLCKNIIKQEDLDFNDPDIRQYAIQKLYSDSLKIYNPATKKTEIYYPFVYDFTDPLGDKDFRNYFVVKLLHTHSGQCHTMPLLYLMLAARLQVEAYLSKAPSHSFIQYKDKEGVLHYFETTNGHTMTRGFYMDGKTHINSSAIKNRIFLDPIPLKQTIAELLLELALHYRQKFGTDDFQRQCAVTALKYFPNCSQAVVTLYNAEVVYCAHIARGYGYPPLKDFEKYPSLNTKFNNMVAVQEELEDSGYSEMDAEEYMEWIRSGEMKEYREKNLALEQKIKANKKNK